MGKHLGRLCLGLSVALIAVGCGKPAAPGVTVQRKTIVAHQLSPNVMMLIDRSGSMTTNTSTAPPCPNTIGGCGPGNACPAGCPTRIGDVKSSLSTMLLTNGATMRVGVSIFPGDNACGATDPNSVLLPLLGPSLQDDRIQNQMQADAANNSISTINSQGGMPTADSLRFLAGQAELADLDRDNFVMLFTSGAPSCNATTADAVAAINDLAAKSIRTIVIAIGAEPAAADALNQMAIAGRFARACPMGTDAECGSSDTCNLSTRTCNRAFFAAADAAELTAQLLQMTMGVPNNVSCTFRLEKVPSSVSKLEVTVDGRLSARCADATGCNNWTFDEASNDVVFQGTTCQRIRDSTPQAPVSLAFAIFD